MNEKGRSLNRRVRVLLDDTILTPVALQAAPKAVDTGVETPDAENLQEVKQPEIATEKTGSQFPWWIIPLVLIGLAIIAAIIFLASRRRRDTTGGQKMYVLKEEEIRRHAYELYQQRNGQNGDAAQDWYQSAHELTVHYDALGYWVILDWEIQALAA